MNIEVRYLSKSGNTKKLAERIANTAGCEAKSIEYPVNQKTDILFLGASVYWGGIDKDIKQYIDSLDNRKIKKVIVFSTSAMTERAFPSVKKLLDKKGIDVNDENFYCRGEFKVLHKGRPNIQDLKEVQHFAEKILRKSN